MWQLVQFISRVNVPNPRLDDRCIKSISSHISLPFAIVNILRVVLSNIMTFFQTELFTYIDSVYVKFAGHNFKLFYSIMFVIIDLERIYEII
jgi:hypothetical protein